MAPNLVFQEETRHVQIDRHFVRENVLLGEIKK